MAVRARMLDRTFDELLDGARAGEQGAYVSLWRQFNAPLLRYLRVMAGDDEAEDLASITWLEIARGLHAFDGDEDQFRARLFTTARHRFFDARRNAGRRPATVELGEAAERVDTASDPQVVVDRVAGTEAALAMIATLPPDQAEVVMLRVVGGLDVAAVARIVEKKPGTVRVLAHRGLQRLMTSVCVAEDSGGVTR